MPLDRPWTPTFRCVRCGRLAVREGLRAWIFQPVTPDGGPVHFECRRCRLPDTGRRGQDRRAARAHRAERRP